MAELSSSQESALNQIVRGPNAEYSLGDNYDDYANQDFYSAKNFKNLKDFMISVARSTSQVGQEDTRSTVLLMKQIGECLPYSSENNPELAGTATPTVDTSINYEKTVTVEKSKKTERGLFEGEAEWSYELSNCRSRDYDVEEIIYGDMQPSYSSSEGT